MSQPQSLPGQMNFLPPAGRDRRFYVIEQPTQAPRAEPWTELAVMDYMAAGWNGHLLLVGDAPPWRTPADYGLVATPKASPVAAPPPVAAPTPAPAPVPTPAAAPVPAVVAGNTTLTIKQLLKEFAKQPGCQAYKNDGERLKLLTQYLWLRQLTPQLPFESFLKLFAPLADFNEENRKHPEDALKFHCPRSGKAAGAGHQWSAKEVVEFISLYVDMIRDAEQQQVPVPMGFEQCLTALKAGFLAGQFSQPEPEPPAAAVDKSKRKAAASVAVRPTSNGQRIVYTSVAENGRQLRGVVESVVADGDREYVTFMADDGQRHEAVNILHCEVITDPPPQGPHKPSGDSLPMLTHKVLTIAKAVAPQIMQALTMPTAMGNVAIGDAIHSYSVDFGNDYEGALDIINGETGPFVDARLVNTLADTVIFEVPPRRVLAGEYRFELPEGILLLEVKVRE